MTIHTVKDIDTDGIKEMEKEGNAVYNKPKEK